MFLSEWPEYPSAPCLAGKKNLITARVSMLLKLRASLTCFRVCFIPGGAKDLSALGTGIERTATASTLSQFNPGNVSTSWVSDITFYPIFLPKGGKNRFCHQF